MKMTLAWDITQGDSSIIVAILDTGCRWYHPEFLGRIWINPDEIDSNGVDDDKNGYVDDIRGWNFIGKNNNIDDTKSHGTIIASIIGANGNNGNGIAGVDWRCKLMMLNVLGVGDSLDTTDIANAIRYAVDNGARVVNMSFVTNRSQIMTDEAIEYGLSKGVIFVGGSGNDDEERVRYPASIPGVIAVGSTDPDDKLSHKTTVSSGTGSNYGERLDLVAPGNWILGLDISMANPYSKVGSGTSLATAFVSGICALLLAKNPNLNASQVRDILRNSADDQVGLPSEDMPGWDKYHGAGRVNAYKALTYQAGAIRFVKIKPGKTRALGAVSPILWRGHHIDVAGRRIAIPQ